MCENSSATKSRNDSMEKTSRSMIFSVTILKSKCFFSIIYNYSIEEFEDDFMEIVIGYQLN